MSTREERQIDEKIDAALGKRTHSYVAFIAPAILGILLTVVGYWVYRNDASIQNVDTEISKLDDRVTGVETSLSALDARMSNVEKSVDKVGARTDDIMKLLMDRLPPKENGD
jgi:peptidoglycan hydrolase CwlO-like protein